MSERGLLNYFGGKVRLAKPICDLMPKHDIYAEPFAGGAAVFFQKPRSRIEGLNDVNELITNIFEVLRDRPDELRQYIALIPYSQAVLDKYKKEQDIISEENPVARAAAYIYKSHGAFAGVTSDTKSALRFSTNRNFAEFWDGFPDFVPLLADRMRGVYIHKEPALRNINRFNDKDALLYCDPPYVAETRSGYKEKQSHYTYEMTEADHRELAEALHAHKGMVMLSGYPSPLYDDDLYKGWKRIDFATLDRMRQKKIDCLYLNEAAIKQNELL